MDIHAITSSDVLDRIARHCPAAMTTYLHCLHRVDDDMRYHFDKKTVEEDLSEDWRVFKNHIKKLSRENLLEWHAIDNGILINLLEIT